MGSVSKELARIPKKAAIAAFLVVAAAASSWFWYGYWKEKTSPHILLSAFHSLYGDFSGGIFRFSVEDFSRNLVLDHEGLEKYRFSDLPHDFFAQSVNPVDGWVLVSGGKPGNSPGSGIVYSITPSGAISPFMRTEDYRLRNCGTGTINGEPYFAGITHGKGYLQLRNLATGKDRILNIPYVPKVNVWGNSFATLFHFVDFIDLDHDGNDEIYLTTTSPYAGVQGTQSQYAEGTVMSVSFDKGSDKPKLENIGIPLPAFPRRLLALRAPFKESVLVLFDGMLDGDGKTVLPVRIFRYFRDAKGQIVKNKVAELPDHSECKTITTLNFLDEPTIQIGCDNSVLYFFQEKVDGLELVKTMKFSEHLMDAEYLAKRSGLKPWSIYSIHTVFGKDVDGDGKDEMIVGINNDGFYLVDSKNPDDRSKRIGFGFKGGERVIDRDEQFVFTDGAFENTAPKGENDPFFR